MAYDLLEAWELLQTGNVVSVAGYGWTFSNSPTIVAGQQRSGTRAMEMNATDFGSYPISNSNEKVAGGAFKYTAALNTGTRDNPLMYFTFSSGGPVWVRLNAASQIVLMNGTTEVATGTSLLNNGTYYFIELRVNRITGACAVYLNFDGVGTPVAEVSATISGLANFQTFRLGHFNTISVTATTIYSDDLYVNNGTVVGDSAVLYDFPVSNNTPQDWTPSSGNAWDRIDNVPVDAAQYIEATTAGDTSNFNFGGYTETIYQVYATQLVTNWLRTGATAETARQGFNIAGTDYYAAARTVPQTTAEWARDIFELNPATGVQWLPSEIQTGSIGSLDRVT
jgi:hypothetical protein